MKIATNRNEHIIAAKEILEQRNVWNSYRNPKSHLDCIDQYNEIVAESDNPHS